MRPGKPTLWLFLGLVITEPRLLAQELPDASREALLQANAARFAAMVRRDLRGLDTLLAPELTYIHTDGELESKAAFLATLQSGRLRYRVIKPAELEARLYGDVGVVTGRSQMQVKVGEELLRFSIRFTALYRRDSTRWVLVAWQATRLPGS